MAFSKHLRTQPKAATERATPSASSRPSGLRASSGAAVAIINPTADDEVDRLLASAGPARGVVVSARNEMSEGSRPERTRVHVTVRPRLHGGALGNEAVLTVWVGWKVAALLEPGLEIPVQLNRSSGRIDAIATDLLARELAPRLDEAKRRQPVAPTPSQARADPLGPPTGPARPDPGGTAMTPIGDVSWQQFVAVHAEINTRHPTDADDAAQRHGIAPGAWAAVDAAWTQRVMASPAMATRFGADLEAAQRAQQPR